MCNNLGSMQDNAENIKSEKRQKKQNDSKRKRKKNGKGKIQVEA